jgi:HPt (histidine-containing phosphotransfer) domain-containing protein
VEESGLDPEAVRSLRGLVGDDSEALAEIVDAFLEDAPAQLHSLRAAATTGDADVAGRAAHTLKANGRTFGAGDLADLCQELEAAARGGDLETVAAHLDDVELAWQRVRPALVALRST